MRVMSSSVTARVNEPAGLKCRDGPRAGDPFDRALATGPACPICADALAPASCTASVRRRRPSSVSPPSTAQWRSVRPSGETARYATVVMATPPEAMVRWNSINLSLMAPLGVAPSKVAALMIRFLRVKGPRGAGSNTAGGRPGLAGASVLTVFTRAHHRAGPAPSAGGFSRSWPRSWARHPGRTQGIGDRLRQRGMADHQIREVGVRLRIPQRTPVEPPGMKTGGQRHGHRCGRIPLVLSPGMKIDFGLTPNDGRNFAPADPMAIVRAPNRWPTAGMKSGGRVRLTTMRGTVAAGASGGGSSVPKTTPIAGRATAPTSGSPSTARATWTAQSSRPSENSRVPSSGSMIHTRPEGSSRCSARRASSDRTRSPGNNWPRRSMRN